MPLCQLNFVFLSLLCAADDERRGADTSAPSIELELKQILKLDAGPQLQPGIYELEWTGAELVAVSTRTRQEALRLQAQPRPSAKVLPRSAALTTDKKSGRAVLLVSLGDEELSFTGTLQQPSSRASLVGLDDTGGAVSLPASAPVSSNDAVDVAWRSLFRPQLNHCVERAKKQRWTAEQVKYQRCVCPLVTSFRFPRTAVERTMPLDRTTQVAVRIDAAGRVLGCALAPAPKAP